MYIGEAAFVPQQQTGSDATIIVPVCDSVAPCSIEIALLTCLLTDQRQPQLEFLSDSSAAAAAVAVAGAAACDLLAVSQCFRALVHVHEGHLSALPENFCLSISGRRASDRMNQYQRRERLLLSSIRQSSACSFTSSCSTKLCHEPCAPRFP